MRREKREIKKIPQSYSLKGTHFEVKESFVYGEVDVIKKINEIIDEVNKLKRASLDKAYDYTIEKPI